MSPRRASRARTSRLSWIAAAAALAFAPGAWAQAWLPEKGTVSVSTDYSNTRNLKHYDFRGVEGDFGHTTVDVLSVGLSWSPSNRWMLRADLPLVRAKYNGNFAHPSETDDGHAHQKITDLQVTLHYQLHDGPLAFAPYVGALIPTQNYHVLGHAAPGRGLNEYWVGFYVGVSLNDWIPRTYVQARYNYAFVEKVVGISHDRSNADLELGYFFTPRWSARLLGAWADTYGGVDIPMPPSNPLFPHHDQLAEEYYVNVGGGVAFDVNDRTSMHLTYMESVDGRNTHKVDQRISLGVSWQLGRD